MPKCLEVHGRGLEPLRLSTVEPKANTLDRGLAIHPNSPTICTCGRSTIGAPPGCPPPIKTFGADCADRSIASASSVVRSTENHRVRSEALDEARRAVARLVHLEPSGHVAAVERCVAELDGLRGAR